VVPEGFGHMQASIAGAAQSFTPAARPARRTFRSFSPRRRR
jgi:hypothetical protein